MMKMRLEGVSSHAEELLKRNSNYFTMSLRGGIGNQLFQYFAGLHFALNRGMSVRFNHSGVDHGISIQALGLPGVFEKNGISQKLSSKLNPKSNFLPKKNHISVDKIGFDNNLESFPSKSNVKGFFQTTFYYEEVQKRGIRLVLDDNRVAGPVQDYGKSMLENSVLIHIRRGDYLNGNLTLGNLSASFFRSALEGLPKEASVHILSDANHDDISEFLASWEFSYSLVPRFSGVLDFEYFYLFGKASCIIGSNSSYSWWGAQFASPSTPVILPQPWFRASDLNAQVGEKFYASSWMTIPSVWIQ